MFRVIFIQCVLLLKMECYVCCRFNRLDRIQRTQRSGRSAWHSWTHRGYGIRRIHRIARGHGILRTRRRDGTRWWNRGDWRFRTQGLSGKYRKPRTIRRAFSFIIFLTMCVLSYGRNSWITNQLLYHKSADLLTSVKCGQQI